MVLLFFGVGEVKEKIRRHLARDPGRALTVDKRERYLDNLSDHTEIGRAHV